MKKLSLLIFIFSFLVSCQSNEDPKPKPTTLADRAGIYKATSTQNSSQITITLNNDGTGTFVANTASAKLITLGNPTSTEFFFSFNTGVDLDWTIDFDKNTLQAPLVDFDSALFTIVKQ